MYSELGINIFFTAEGLNNTMWGPLLEKAYAKFVGSYLSLARGGVSSEAVRAITGFPGFVFDTNSTNNTWQIIDSGLEQGDIVTCSSSLLGEGGQFILNSLGINFSQNFAVLDTLILKDESGNITERLLYIRNTQGEDKDSENSYSSFTDF